MASNGHERVRRFSSIDDGLQSLLADLKQEGPAPGSEGPVVLHGFTPLSKPGSLGISMSGDPLLRLISQPSTGAAAASSFFPPAGLAGTTTLLKGSSLDATPVVLPISFVPVSLTGQQNEGGVGSGGAHGAKLRPAGGGSLSALLPHGLLQPSGGSFTIPAYARNMTQLDFISTDDMEDDPQAVVAAVLGGSGGSIAALRSNTLLRGSGGSGLSAVFGDLADESQLGDLPSEDDLRALLFDPQAGAGQAGAHLHPALFFQQAAWGSGVPNHGAGQAAHRLASPARLVPADAAAAVPRVVVPPVLPRVGSYEASGAFDARQQSSLASLKRRVDRLDLEPQQDSSPRSSKRHSSGAWSIGGGEGDSDSDGGNTPRSATPRGAGPSGQQAMGNGSGSTAPSRFRLETRRRRTARSSSDSDPTFSPAASRDRVRPAARQQAQQAQQAQQVQVPTVVVGALSGAGSGFDATTMQYRGVSKHRLTQRWEASLWLNGRQLYLGGFNSQEDAAHAYDLAALACKGPDAHINFSPDDYREQMAEIAGYTRDEVVAYVRRRSSAFSRGKSRFRGVSGHNGRWEARIGSFGGRKNVSFGVFESEEGAARQYDRALILEKGRSAKTNFPTRDYEAEVAAYESHLLAMCGTTRGHVTAEVAASYTLPIDREVTADEKKRSAVIYAESLRHALAQGYQGL